MKPKRTGILKIASSWVVLVVDDMPDNLAVAKTALQFHGAQVYTATDGEEGLKLLQSVQPTVILLDIRMPKMDGWAMFKSVREDPKLAHIPIIAITAYAMDSDKDEILKAGFNGYIAKPFDVFSFIEEIGSVISQSTQQHEKSEDTSK